jgi:hypothetical protein
VGGGSGLRGGWSPGIRLKGRRGRGGPLVLAGPPNLEKDMAGRKSQKIRERPVCPQASPQVSQVSSPGFTLLVVLICE